MLRHLCHPTTEGVADGRGYGWNSCKDDRQGWEDTLGHKERECADVATTTAEPGPIIIKYARIQQVKYLLASRP